MSAIGNNGMSRPTYRAGFTAIGWALQMFARRGGVCAVSGIKFNAGEMVAFNRKTGQVAIWEKSLKAETETSNMNREAYEVPNPSFKDMTLDQQIEAGINDWCAEGRRDGHPYYGQTKEQAEAIRASYND